VAIPLESIVTSKIAASHAVTLRRREIPPRVVLFGAIRSPPALLYPVFRLSIPISRGKCNQKAPACAKKPVPEGRNILQVQQHIGPENVAARFHRQIAVIPVHSSFDGNKADALSVMFGGVQDAALLFQHAIVAVFHH